MKEEVENSDTERVRYVLVNKKDRNSIFRRELFDTRRSAEEVVNSCVWGVRMSDYFEIEEVRF